MTNVEATCRIAFANLGRRILLVCFTQAVLAARGRPSMLQKMALKQGVNFLSQPRAKRVGSRCGGTRFVSAVSNSANPPRSAKCSLALLECAPQQTARRHRKKERRDEDKVYILEHYMPAGGEARVTLQSPSAQQTKIAISSACCI